MQENNQKSFFTKKLLTWNSKYNNRPMPWKGEKDPYKIWLSEIILQQTRVEQGWAYYNRFVSTFPNIEKLAAAPEQKIFKLWEGLGYYTRCKNLLATAKFIANEKQGKFPDRYDEILNLKGVGPYTAAAIASFAFNLPYAVLDGNVFRVLARVFGNKKDISSAEGKKAFAVLAEKVLDKTNPGIYNQAIMDFGAVICKPKNPECENCPLSKICFAYQNNKIEQLPVNNKKLVKKTRWFYYFIIEHKSEIYIRKRTKKDIWQNLYEYVLMESDVSIDDENLLKRTLIKSVIGQSKFKIMTVSNLQQQQLTHQTIKGKFVHIKTLAPLQIDEYASVSLKGIKKLPFPKFITGYLAKNETRYLKDKNVSLNLL